jgi:3-deoxy-manno-octulosonate cytidylyltransferase (CMP-KDO synthetase)
MKVLGVIPSRFGSSRFPGKPLVDLAGKTMVQRVYEGVFKSPLLTDVVVATDDSRIFEHVLSFGGKALMTSDEHQSGTERCGEVLQQFSDFDLVINIQGDEPLIETKQIEELLSVFENPEVQIATLGIALENHEDLFNPNRVKIVLDHQGKALYFSRNPIPYGAQKLKDYWTESYPYLRHIGMYAFRTETLKRLLQLPPTDLEQQESLEQLRWQYYGYAIQVVKTEIETPNIDTPEDVDQVLKLLT